ncbi:hypothetical protein L3Q82_007319 [Scortum barcoo]|uniref:Uncharacterized protein n=1 Tax=Scortum barcoo TaxID=214431 RepID=A0ACB8WTM6_9TELE|nr:hypothetical protein L3Q82_007319 [Scortum barcoo]
MPVVVATPEPWLVDTGSKGCRQAEEGVLSSKPQPGRSWRQKLGSGRNSVRPWRRTIGRPRRDSGKPSGASEGEKQYSANTVYSAGGELLTSTERTLSDGGRNTSPLLNPTDLPSK